MLFSLLSIEGLKEARLHLVHSIGPLYSILFINIFKN